jgi:hypothetical protein
MEVFSTAFLKEYRIVRSSNLYACSSTEHRWEENTKMDLRVIGWGDIDWIHLAQDKYQWRALVNTL